MEIKGVRVDRHYGFGGLQERIQAGLESAGKQIDSLTIEDLAPVDEFHIRGRKATLELAELADLSSTDRVLDVGCGLGGTARCLAHRFGCRVAGIDITEEYVAVAQALNGWVGLSDRVDVRQGSALDIPYGDGEFDIVWTEHVQMNIVDKQRFYSEMARVLKPGGRLLFHDIFRGAGDSPHYPTPWAEDESLSDLVTETKARGIIESLGLSIENWSGKMPESIGFFEKALIRMETAGPPPIGIHLLLGSKARQKLVNLLGNLKEDRVSVAQGIARK